MAERNEPRRVLITGANRGLGAELVRVFAEGGDLVWGTARPGRTDRLQALDPAGVIEMDVADEASVVAGFELLATELDGLDVLINCAGIDARTAGAETGARGPFDLDAAAFEQVMRVNVTGPMVVTREALALLRRGRDPIVVDVSSQLGSMSVGVTGGRDTSYCVSKAALNMLGAKTAVALRPAGIAVVLLHPGWVSTDMGGPGASLTPADSATAIHRTIGSLTLADSGRFIDWDGRDHPW